MVDCASRATSSSCPASSRRRLRSRRSALLRADLAHARRAVAGGRPFQVVPGNGRSRPSPLPPQFPARPDSDFDGPLGAGGSHVAEVNLPSADCSFKPDGPVTVRNRARSRRLPGNRGAFATGRAGTRRPPRRPRERPRGPSVPGPAGQGGAGAGGCCGRGGPRGQGPSPSWEAAAAAVR